MLEVSLHFAYVSTYSKQVLAEAVIEVDRS
jgi:hypothetical protein